MNIEEIKSELTKTDSGTKVYEAVASLVLAEQERGKEESRKSNSEAQGLRKRLKAITDSLRDMGYDVDIDPDSILQIKELKARAGKADEAGQKSTKLTDEVLSYQRQLAEVNGKLSLIIREKEATTKKLQSKTMREALSLEFGDRIFAKEHTITSLISDGKVSIDGERVIFVDGDSKTSLADGVKALIDAGKVDLKVVQKAGLGSHGATQVGTKTDEQKQRFINSLRTGLGS